MIDAATGHVVHRQSLVWWPVIDGRRPAFLRSTAAYDGPTYRIYARSEVKPTSHTRLPAARTGPKQAGLPDLKNDCWITIGDRVDPNFTSDFEAVNQEARKLNVRSFTARDGEGLDRKIRIVESLSKPCKDITIFLFGHGYAPPGSNIPHSAGGGNIPETPVAQVALKTETTDVNGKPYVDQTTFDANELHRILSRHLTTTFKLLVDSCFSGRWAEPDYVVGGLPPGGPRSNLRVIETSVRSDQIGFGYFPAGMAWQVGSQTNGILTLSDERRENTTFNPAHSSGFVNATIQGIDRWAHSENPGTDFAKGLVSAFGAHAEFNYGHQIGWMNPQLRDNTGPPSGNLGCQGEARASMIFPSEIDIGVFGCNVAVVKDVFTFHHAIPDFSRAALFRNGPSSFTPYDCTGKGTPIITCGPFDPPISPGPQNGLIISVPTLKSGDTISADISAIGRRMHLVVTVP
jgi:hypothetical protein